MQYINSMVLVAALALPGLAHAARSGESVASDEIASLQRMLEEMRTEYEERISALETRLARAERAADQAFEIAEDTAISAGSGRSAPNAFNPAIGAVLVGRHSDLDNSWEAIPGFATDGELGPGDAGFSLGESELNFKAAIDANFYGNLTLALEDEDGDTEVAVEEAWIQTLGLPLGFTATAGRHFSGIGYLNGFHRHADDFSDRPLPYQAFFGGQYIGDGAQLRWLAPTALFLELGAELNWGNRFPATGSGSSPDAWNLFAHVGGDLGSSHSWQLGLSYLDLDVDERGAGDHHLRGVSNHHRVVRSDRPGRAEAGHRAEHERHRRGDIEMIDDDVPPRQQRDVGAPRLFDRLDRAAARHPVEQSQVWQAHLGGDRLGSLSLGRDRGVVRAAPHREVVASDHDATPVDQPTSRHEIGGRVAFDPTLVAVYNVAGE